jgi:hypothetical protein
MMNESYRSTGQPELCLPEDDADCASVSSFDNNVMDLLDSSCTRGFFDLVDKDKPKADQQPLQV